MIGYIKDHNNAAASCLLVHQSVPVDGKSEPYSPANCIHFDPFQFSLSFLFSFFLQNYVNNIMNENGIFTLQFYNINNFSFKCTN